MSAIWAWLNANAGAMQAVFAGVLVVLTFAYVIFTLMLWEATKTAARAAQASSEHIPRAERAYIYGGFGPQHGGRRLILLEDGSKCFELSVTMANYGRTPGFIKFIQVGKAKLGELPDEPAFEQTFDILDLYFPGMTMADVRRTRARIRVPADGDHAVYQRVFYTDVFGKEHFSGSIYRMYLDGADHIADKSIEPNSAYWFTEEDEAKSSVASIR